MGAGVVVAVACTGAEIDLLERAGSPLGAALQRVDGPDGLASALDGAEGAVVVIGSGTDEFVRFAQACHRMRPNVVTIVLTDADRYHEARTELATAPFVSLAAICVPVGEQALVEEYVRRAVDGVPLGSDELLSAARLRLEALSPTGSVPHPSPEWVLSELPVGLAVLGASGDVHLWNERMEAMSGTASRTAVGAPLLQSLSADRALAAAVGELWAGSDAMWPGARAQVTAETRLGRVSVMLLRLADARPEGRFFLLVVPG